MKRLAPIVWASCTLIGLAVLQGNAEAMEKYLVHMVLAAVVGVVVAVVLEAVE